MGNCVKFHSSIEIVGDPKSIEIDSLDWMLCSQIYQLNKSLTSEWLLGK